MNKKYYKHLIWHGIVSIVECIDHSYAYSGNMPCTGLYRCVYCGNSKLHNVYVFDLPAVKSCLNSSKCHKSCYAMYSQRIYLNTRKWRNGNYELAKDTPDTLFKLLFRQLSKISKKDNNIVVRMHSSGDFFNQAYIDVWHDIITCFPAIRFYAYTKVLSKLDFKEIRKTVNFNLIDSTFFKGLNYGTLDYITALSKQYNGFICPATTEKDIKCNLHCNYCLTGSKPLFKIHGNGNYTRNKKEVLK